MGSESGPNQIKDHGRGPTGTDDFGGAKRKLDQPPVITIRGSKHRSSPEMMGAEDRPPLIPLVTPLATGNHRRRERQEDIVDEEGAEDTLNSKIFLIVLQATLLEYKAYSLLIRGTH